MGVRTIVFLAFVAAAAAATASGEEWPRWRGPRGDGISREPPIARWPAGGPRRVWSAPVGAGFASPVAAGGRVYLFAHALTDEKREVLTAYDADTGRVAWSVGDDGGWTGSYPGTRASPVIDGDRIFTFGGGGDLVCRQLADGKLVWKLNVLAATGAHPLEWGSASNPAVDGDAVYVQAGAAGPVAVAVSRATGRLLWQSEARGNASYAAPLLVAGPAPKSGRAGGTPGLPAWRQLVVFAAAGLYGLDPSTGKTLWHEPWVTSWEVNAATPIYRDGQLLVSSGYGHGALALRLSATGATRVWESRDVQTRFNPPILDGEHLYANSEGTPVCARWSDGALAWSAKRAVARLGLGGSLVRLGDELLALSDHGELMLLRATPAGVERLGAAQVVDGSEVWATPLVYRGRIYVRGEGALVALDPSRK
jgi:outer membrane protein assembly factor BamB